MKDNEIIELYWERNEAAITATAEKYGSYCHTISYNILLDSALTACQLIWVRSYAIYHLTALSSTMPKNGGGGRLGLCCLNWKTAFLQKRMWSRALMKWCW